jgi:hypothetical protein
MIQNMKIGKFSNRKENKKLQHFINLQKDVYFTLVKKIENHLWLIFLTPFDGDIEFDEMSITCKNFTESCYVKIYDFKSQNNFDVQFVPNTKTKIIYDVKNNQQWIPWIPKNYNLYQNGYNTNPNIDKVTFFRSHNYIKVKILGQNQVGWNQNIYIFIPPERILNCGNSESIQKETFFEIKSSERDF